MVSCENRSVRLQHATGKAMENTELVWCSMQERTSLHVCLAGSAPGEACGVQLHS